MKSGLGARIFAGVSIYGHRIRLDPTRGEGPRRGDWKRRSADASEPLLRFRNAGMFDALAHCESLRERALRERGFMVGEVSFAPDLRGVRFAPRVLTLRSGCE